MPAENPHIALQQKALRIGYHALKARNFHAHRGTTADHLNHVLMYTLAGEQSGGPFSVEEADAWLDRAKLAKLATRGRPNNTATNQADGSGSQNEKSILQQVVAMHRGVGMSEAEIEKTPSYMRLVQLGAVPPSDRVILEEVVAMHRNAGMPQDDIEKTPSYKRLTQLGGAK